MIMTKRSGMSYCISKKDVAMLTIKQIVYFEMYMNARDSNGSLQQF